MRSILPLDQSIRGDNDLIGCRIVILLIFQRKESEQLNDFPTVKVTCYYFEDCPRV